MQTFLPYPNFEQSAKALDYKRLGKQRVETLQLIRAISGLTKGWSNHPAAKMWQGHLHYLAIYGLTMSEEWTRRGYKDTIKGQFVQTILTNPTGTPPPWLGNSDFHKSHQSNLIRKLPQHYAPLFPNVPDNLPYIWPTKGLAWFLNP